MQPSKFNVQVPVADRDEVFLMNTLSDAQLLVSRDVTGLIERVTRGESLTGDELETVETLRENGFLVDSREQEDADLREYFISAREDTDQMRVTVLTTLQCNFACDYCFQGDHGDYNKTAAKMSLETAAGVVAWITKRLDEVQPKKLVLTLFGGEPLLNLPAAYYLAEHCYAACQARGVDHHVSIITNGLLLTPEVVNRLKPYGLRGVKITLDGDRHTHNKMRPLRGGQGTFDRIIENMRQVGPLLPLTLGGNFDEASADSYPALLDFLREQDFADHIIKINFKPVIKSFEQAVPKGFIPLTAVSSTGKPLNGTCMTSAGAGSTGGPCDTCHFTDDKMQFLREETRKRGFHTPDGVKMGPCEIHRRHAYTIGPEGSLYACPGFSGEAKESTGHIDGRDDTWRNAAAERFERLSAHKEACGDCSFIPVCGGGCSVAAHTELGDMNHPSCHKESMELALVSLAQRTAASFS